MKLYDIPEGKVVLRNDLIEQNTVVVGKVTFHFDNEAEASLLYEAVSVFGSGQFLLPDNEADARRTLTDWLAHKAELNAWFRQRSESCSDDEEYVARMIKQFWVLYRDYRRGLKNPPASLKSPVRRIHVEPSPDGEPRPIELSVSRLAGETVTQVETLTALF
jgi:hypothetical protein